MKTEKQLQLVTFEQAERLNKAGFNWETGKMYWSTGMGIQKPTVALALKWLRDVKGIKYDGGFYSNDNVYRFYFGFYKKPPFETRTDVFDTYEQAESALLDELLTLI